MFIALGSSSELPFYQASIGIHSDKCWPVHSSISWTHLLSAHWQLSYPLWWFVSLFLWGWNNYHDLHSQNQTPNKTYLFSRHQINVSISPKPSSKGWCLEYRQMLPLGEAIYCFTNQTILFRCKRCHLDPGNLFHVPVLF